MALETGTATGVIDLFDKLRDFLTDPTKGDWDPLPTYPTVSDSTGIEHIVSADSEGWKLFDAHNEVYGLFSDDSYVQIKLVAPITLREIKLSVPSLAGGVLLSSPKSLELQESSDGLVWNSLKTWSNIGSWNDLDMKTFALDADHTGRWFRLYFRESNSGSACYASTLLLIKDDSTVHYLYASPGSNNLVVPRRLLLKSSYSASGIHAHVELFATINSDTKIYSIGVLGGSEVNYDIEEGNGLPRAEFYNPSSPTYAYLWDASMEYWFYGDYRQFYAAFRVGSTIQSFGFGYHLAYATPAQYPLPMFVAGANSSATNTWETDTSGDIKSFPNPGNGALFVFSPDNAWEEVQNYAQVYPSGETLQPGPVCLWPGCQSTYNTQRNAPGANDTDGNFILYPLIIKKTDNSIYGELKNVYLIPSLNLTSGDTILIGSDVYRVFQNCWRTSQQDYYAIKEE